MERPLTTTTPQRPWGAASQLHQPPLFDILRICKGQAPQWLTHNSSFTGAGSACKDLDWCSQKLGSNSAGEDRWGMCWDPPSFQLCWWHFSCWTVGLCFSSVSSYCCNTWWTFSCSFLTSNARLSWDFCFSNCWSAHPGNALGVLYLPHFHKYFYLHINARAKNTSKSPYPLETHDLLLNYYSPDHDL